MYTISVINQKGGVGKTVTTVNLAAALQKRGAPPLVIDYDPQMNATDWLMGREAKEEDPTIFDALSTLDGEQSDQWMLSELARTSDSVGVDFIPSDRRMAAASFDSVVGRSPVFPHQLRRRLRELRTAQVSTNSLSANTYEYCLIDCPPSLGRSIATALAASDGVVVPIHADRFSMRGVTRLQDTIEQIRKVHNDGLRILGLLANNLDLRSGLVSEMKDKFRDVYEDILFETAIRWRSKINEAATYGENILDYESDASDFYLDLADEVQERARIAATA